MRHVLRRLAAAVTHSGPGYDPPARSEADLRTALAALVDRWAIQLADYNDQATEPGDGRAARHDARIRGTRLQHCINDIQIVLAHGRLPHDLADSPRLLPRRGDEFEAWLGTQRDNSTSWSTWHELDCLLDRYRLRADTGTSLGDHVCEGRVIGDCECLERPTGGAS